MTPPIEPYYASFSFINALNKGWHEIYNAWQKFSAFQFYRKMDSYGPITSIIRHDMGFWDCWDEYLTHDLGRVILYSSENSGLVSKRNKWFCKILQNEDFSVIIISIISFFSLRYTANCFNKIKGIILQMETNNIWNANLRNLRDCQRHHDLPISLNEVRFFWTKLHVYNVSVFFSTAALESNNFDTFTN